MTSRRERGFTLVELLVVISIIAFLAGALIVAAREIHKRTQYAATMALMEKIQNANDQFYNEWRFYAPDQNIDELGGESWTYGGISPSIPELVETAEVDATAPGMPDPRDKMPTTPNEYMMVNLVFRFPVLKLTAEQLCGPERNLTDAKLRLKNGDAPRTRCIIKDAWGRPLFYDCHSPPGRKVYAQDLVKYNVNAFDLFSLGPDGRTSATDNNVDDDGDGDVDETDEGTKIGQGPDDINNWAGLKRQ